MIIFTGEKDGKINQQIQPVCEKEKKKQKKKNEKTIWMRKSLSSAPV